MAGRLAGRGQAQGAECARPPRPVPPGRCSKNCRRRRPPAPCDANCSLHSRLTELHSRSGSVSESCRLRHCETTRDTETDSSTRFPVTHRRTRHAREGARPEQEQARSAREARAPVQLTERDTEGDTEEEHRGGSSRRRSTRRSSGEGTMQAPCEPAAPLSVFPSLTPSPLCLPRLTHPCCRSAAGLGGEDDG